MKRRKGSKNLDHKKASNEAKERKREFLRNRLPEKLTEELQCYEVSY